MRMVRGRSRGMSSRYLKWRLWKTSPSISPEMSLSMAHAKRAAPISRFSFSSSLHRPQLGPQAGQSCAALARDQRRSLHDPPALVHQGLVQVVLGPAGADHDRHPVRSQTRVQGLPEPVLDLGHLLAGGGVLLIEDVVAEDDVEPLGHDLAAHALRVEGGVLGAVPARALAEPLGVGPLGVRLQSSEDLLEALVALEGPADASGEGGGVVGALAEQAEPDVRLGADPVAVVDGVAPRALGEAAGLQHQPVDAVAPALADEVDHLTVVGGGHVAEDVLAELEDVILRLSRQA